MLISPVVPFRAHSNLVSEHVVAMEWPEQLLVWERGLDEREDALLAREHGMVEAERSPGRARVECNTIHH
jgi:hypothetical protein